MFDEVQGVLHGTWPTETDALLAVHAAFRRLPADQLSHLAPARIAILGGYTTKFVTPLVQLFLARAGVLATMWEGDYGLAEQISHDPAALAAFNPDVVFLCVGTEHLDLANPSGEATRWKNIWRRLHESLSCDIVQNTFEPSAPRLYGSFDVRDPQSPVSIVRRINAAMIEDAPAYVHFNDVDGRAAHRGRAQWRDQTLYDMTKLPCAFDALPAYARSVSAVIAALRGRSKKCLVVDLDNTLWGGVLGDDGIASVRVGAEDGEGEAFARFQSYLKRLRQRGVLLAIASKNDEALVRQCFAERTEMPLAWSDFAATAINWEPKHQNLMRLSQQLNIGLDAFVFVDDNPAEREIVRQHLPLVEVVDLPEDPAGFAEAVADGSWFDAVSLTNEDRDRTSQYQANALRDAEWQSAGDYDAFLTSLNMTATLQPVTAANVVRVTQLINKTNQFNLTTRRYPQAQVEKMAGDPNWVTLAVTLADRFGDNGLISVVLAQVAADRALNVDTWLMSCRVLKRGVESMLWHALLRAADSRGLTSVTGTYIPTARNTMVARLFEECGASMVTTEADGTTHWHAPVTQETIAAAAARLAPIAVGLNETGSTL